MPIAYTYAPPGAQVIAGAPPTIPPPNTGAAVIAMIGRAPQGPRHMVYCTAAQAVNIFGSAGGNLLTGGFGSTGFDLPMAIRLANMQRNPSGTVPLQFLVGRAGVSPATYVVLDRTPVTPVAAFTLSGEGKYAGTYGVNLAVSITLNGSFAVTTLDIMDISAGAGNPILLQRFNSITNDLRTNSSIVAAINGANPSNDPSSIVSAVLAAGTPTTPAALATVTPFAAGTPNDGKAATWADATIAGLLTEMLQYPVDWLYAGFDEATCAASIQATQLLAQNNNTPFRTILGPALGTTYTSMSTTYINAVTASERVSGCAHDGVMITNPTTGVPTVMDGFMLSAIAIGAKASGPASDAAINTPLYGITDIAPAPGNNNLPLTPAQRVALALPSGATNNQGQIVAWKDPVDNAVKFIDLLTTAPYLVNGGKNIFNNVFATHINDGFNVKMFAAGKPFIGRSPLSISLLQQNLVASAQNQTAQLAGSVQNVQLAALIDPSSGQPVLSGNYEMVSPPLNITIPTSFILATSGT